jgi:hypothetical protein|tara:strand:- start:8135 stop:8731 length:597 start_codon:yes stop_codon:yes gene_type:complete
MSKALVIGNGESRRGTELEKYKPEYTLVGCNAVHRDIIVDHLICCDRRMAAESTDNPLNSNTQIYVRPSWFHFFRKIKKNKNIRTVPDLPYAGNIKVDHPDHWGSGGYAVLVAASLGFNEIELIGFDLYPVDKSVNNIYKGTPNYAKEGAQAVDASYWVYQIAKVFQCYPHIKFTVRNKQLWNMPVEWQKNNVIFLAL